MFNVFIARNAKYRNSRHKKVMKMECLDVDAKYRLDFTEFIDFIFPKLRKRGQKRNGDHSSIVLFVFIWHRVEPKASHLPVRHLVTSLGLLEFYVLTL